MLRRIKEHRFTIIAFIALTFMAIFLPDSFTVFVAGMVWGAFIAVTLILYFFKVQKKLPYTWTCPREGCHYHIETSEGGEMMILEIAEDHDREHEMGDR